MPQADWEKDFDKFLKPHTCAEEFRVDSNIVYHVKFFIRSLLAQERQAFIKTLEGLKGTEGLPEDDFFAGLIETENNMIRLFNAKIDQALKELQ